MFSIFVNQFGFCYRCNSKPTFLWQKESQNFLPCGSTSIAKKFLRCILYQLAPNGVFAQIFQMKHNGNNHNNLLQTLMFYIKTYIPIFLFFFFFIESNDNNFFKSIIQALMDFNEMNPIEPLQMVLEVSNSMN